MIHSETMQIIARFEDVQLGPKFCDCLTRQMSFPWGEGGEQNCLSVMSKRLESRGVLTCGRIPVSLGLNMNNNNNNIRFCGDEDKVPAYRLHIIYLLKFKKLEFTT